MAKIPVGVLGATGAVGQRFVQLLADHPWFEVVELAASDRSAGKPYKDACTWRLGTPMPESVAARVVKTCDEKFESRILFSGLDSSVAGEVETALSSRGHAVVVLNKGMTSRGGKFAFAAQESSLRPAPLADKVQRIKVTDEGPVWEKVRTRP